MKPFISIFAIALALASCLLSTQAQAQLSPAQIVAITKAAAAGNKSAAPAPVEVEKPAGNAGKNHTDNGGGGITPVVTKVTAEQALQLAEQAKQIEEQKKAMEELRTLIVDSNKNVAALLKEKQAREQIAQPQIVKDDTFYKLALPYFFGGLAIGAPFIIILFIMVIGDRKVRKVIISRLPPPQLP